MSASEKLKALEHEPRTQLDVVNNALRLHEVQAQIVAVVEAAEGFDMEQHRSVRTETIWSKLHAALAALEEALSS